MAYERYSPVQLPIPQAVGSMPRFVLYLNTDDTAILTVVSVSDAKEILIALKKGFPGREVRLYQLPSGPWLT